ncbi:hypothetical protein TNCV_4905961 [Trichonephila clavipes]|uniref:Uncharacterized protein n=1 Tax=Trichonephila clavipes TaxID=2585209 RepID=A0A8X6RPH4_TRICX|nr:hypothetical protein TNCV_4905961 [Trichonephila clavipes]
MDALQTTRNVSKEREESPKTETAPENVEQVCGCLAIEGTLGPYKPLTDHPSRNGIIKEIVTSRPSSNRESWCLI